VEVAEEIGVAIRTLIHFFASRWSHKLAVWCLIFIQAQLLWVAEFHHHEADQIVPAGPLVIRRSAISTQRAAVRPRCAACQIGRQNVARPARGFPFESPDLVILSPSASVLLDRGLSRLTVIPARAPPVF
jgi:hypothetical protein